jgi:hypothetical protein
MDAKFDIYSNGEALCGTVETFSAEGKYSATLKLYEKVLNSYKSMSRRDKRQYKRMVKAGYAENE